ncbi:hypothetical protein GCM10027416_08600 [Okibacterium endophyticum]
MSGSSPPARRRTARRSPYTGSEGAQALNEDFTTAVIEVVESIPPGRVMSYGQVAAMIGSRSARGVGRVMALYGENLPWWRVVRAGGHPPQCHEASALEHYRDEGTPTLESVNGYRIAPSAFV